MERIILEMRKQGLNQYQVLDKFPISIGRAYDNDVILSDRSVSAHHAKIERSEDGELNIQNLSNENGTVLNGKWLDGEKPETIRIPSGFSIGNVKLRLVSSSTSIEETHRNDCDNIFCILGQPLWSTLLFSLTILTLFIGNYLDNPFDKGFIYYFTALLPYLLITLIGTLLASVVSRITIQRWHILPILSVISLLILIPELLSHIGHMLNYLVTSDTPQEILDTISQYILPFTLIFFFILKVYKSKPSFAFSIAIACGFFLSLPHLLDYVDNLSIDSDFSDIPPYNQTLSSLDMRLDKTIDLDEYIVETEDKLQKQIRRELDNNN